jgi:hypothetical protein
MNSVVELILGRVSDSMDDQMIFVLCLIRVKIECVVMEILLDL